MKICCVLRGESHTIVCGSVVTQEIQLKLLSLPETVSLASRPWSPSVFTTLSFTPIAFSSALPPLHSFLDRMAFFLPVKSCFHSHRQTLRCPSVLKQASQRHEASAQQALCSYRGILLPAFSAVGTFLYVKSLMQQTETSPLNNPRNHSRVKYTGTV